MAQPVHEHEAPGHDPEHTHWGSRQWCDSGTALPTHLGVLALVLGAAMLVVGAAARARGYAQETVRGDRRQDTGRSPGQHAAPLGELQHVWPLWHDDDEQLCARARATRANRTIAVRMMFLWRVRQEKKKKEHVVRFRCRSRNTSIVADRAEQREQLGCLCEQRAVSKKREGKKKTRSTRTRPPRLLFRCPACPRARLAARFNRRAATRDKKKKQLAGRVARASDCTLAIFNHHKRKSRHSLVFGI